MASVLALQVATGSSKHPWATSPLDSAHASENPLWGEQRIANELLGKLGVRVLPWTVRLYIPKRPAGEPSGDQRWSTFLKNHADAVGLRFFRGGDSHFPASICVCGHPSWFAPVDTFECDRSPERSLDVQQFREVFGVDERYCFLLHDRDSIFASNLDEFVERLGLKALKTPVRSPMANAICERLIGSVRRGCLDWLIPLSESHLRLMLKAWQRHYNRSRPHMALGPDVPDPQVYLSAFPAEHSRHRIGKHLTMRAKSVLGGLHHEYSLVRVPA